MAGAYRRGKSAFSYLLHCVMFSGLFYFSLFFLSFVFIEIVLCLHQSKQLSRYSVKGSYSATRHSSRHAYKYSRGKGDSINILKKKKKEKEIINGKSKHLGRATSILFILVLFVLTSGANSIRDIDCRLVEYAYIQIRCRYSRTLSFILHVGVACRHHIWTISSSAHCS